MFGRDKDDLDLENSNSLSAPVPVSVSVSKLNLPWIEKYRPKRLDQVSHQEDVVSTLKRAILAGNLPHLLFYGPPGTGKTSTILAAAYELYGPLVSRRVLELNASNERGIDVVRHRIKDFAQVAVSHETVNGFPCPPFKLIILDEADSMTRDAQSALRRTMEQYSKVTRFCIICNYVSRIIDPITSRCAKFRFRPLSQESMFDRLTLIAKNEGVTIEETTLNKLIKLSEGDMRASISLLQTAHRFTNTQTNNNNDNTMSTESISENDLIEVAGIVPPSRINDLLDSAKKHTFSAIKAAAENIIFDAYPVNTVLSQLVPAILSDSSINDLKKSKIFIRISEADLKLIQGADELLQLMDVLSFIENTIHSL